MTEQTQTIGQPYEIESVSGAEAPPGAVGTDWYKYVIVQGKNTIQGHRQGKLSAVTSAVEEIVMQLNERRLGRRGRVNLVPTPKKRA